jgi:transcriptional regulator with XRE-family HTH domain
MWKELQSAGISQSEFARRIGTSRAYVNQVCLGTRPVSQRMLEEFSKATGKHINIVAEITQ